jgi:hypothetical protein
VVDTNAFALILLVVLAFVLALYLLKIDDNVGHLFMLLGIGLFIIGLLPYIFGTPGSVGGIMFILALGCIAWGLSLRNKRFRLKKRPI